MSYMTIWVLAIYILDDIIKPFKKSLDDIWTVRQYFDSWRLVQCHLFQNDVFDAQMGLYAFKVDPIQCKKNNSESIGGVV